MIMKWYIKLDVAYERCPIVFQGHPSNFKVTRHKKIVDFDPNWAFPEYNLSLNTPVATKWCTQLAVAWKRYRIVFQYHPSNFKVTRLKKNSILNQIRRFRTLTPVWIYWWLWNDAQSLKQHGRGSLIFSMSSVKFQGYPTQKSSILTQIRRFRTVTQVWIHSWLWNDAKCLK